MVSLENERLLGWVRFDKKATKIKLWVRKNGNVWVGLSWTKSKNIGLEI